MEELEFTYSVPFVAGRTYLIWWHTGIDFKGLHMIADALR